MIIWLASYPRSGNTLLRTILHQSFGVGSYSIYNDRADISSNPAVSKIVGHLMMDRRASRFVPQRAADQNLTFLKTHDAPVNDHRAIYVVRDGRAAVVSYFKYLIQIRGRQDLKLSDVIRGTGVHFGSWSDSIRNWTPMTRPATLVLRFEDLVADATHAIQHIAEFTSLSPIAQWQNEFEKMRSLYPEFSTPVQTIKM